MPSKAIRAFAYDAKRNELTVAFTGGGAYVYSLVSPAVAAAFAASPAQGVFHNAHLRDRYPWRKAPDAASSTRPSLRDALFASMREDAPLADEAAPPAVNE